MSKKKKGVVEYRHYEIPYNECVIALLGKKWVQTYGGLPYLHFHNHLEIGYCYEGTGEVIFDEEPVRYEGEMFTIIPKNYPHTTNSDAGTISKWEYMFIDVDKLLSLLYHNNNYKVERILERISHKPCILPVSEHKKMGALIRDVLEEMRNKREYYKEAVNSEIFVLLTEFARMNETDIPYQESKSSYKTAIHAAVDYICQNYQHTIRIGELAEYCHISETHFRRIFGENMGMSPVEYINLIRIRSACHILKATRDSVGDVAGQCGFLSTTTFYRNFQKIMGVSPQNWRANSEHYEQKLLDFKVDSLEGW